MKRPLLLRSLLTIAWWLTLATASGQVNTPAGAAGYTIAEVTVHGFKVPLGKSYRDELLRALGISDH